ncbi:putative DNA mismatch repair protein [Aspergillus mulundensis]|uniref:DNA mismatch repair protein S5 domain-containing protein n=1 Tax=Aspergillus mulundensis TaxID=1810919 RepID=A0A3D8S6D5_9EURO|nr:hypothetical protein DSM5745_05188 [Aspergillus mulundensis]RDW81631.1 hypothetical protein DSM5745_05188 [Aspergillus mulundensis]
MPIVALPPTTVRAIGSTSIISDPCSLAKELLDNALDASATSVSIEISQDTVDLIQVKDNGHGIPAADHNLVCRRAFTSKIHTVEDLRNIGGKSLGFRGEALASAAEVSGTLTVSTRVDTDPVGSSLKYGRNGELVSTERISHPVGTTVRVSNLFRQIPVRRQTAIKSAKKTLLRIKKMVQAYAMSRPSIRLFFKILKAKNESGNLMYAPGNNATLMEAALKVAGTEVVSNSELKKWPVSSDEVGDSRDDSGYRLIALLPRLGSDFTKFNNLGQYISIDGRPLSSGRGVTQVIVKLYKTYLRSVASRDGLSPPITDPFLCIHILCPEGTYDVNVEPAKDDVLFEDQHAVLSLVEGLLRDIYGDQPDAHADSEPTEQEREPPCRNGFEALLSARPNQSTFSTPTSATNQDRGFMSARSIVPAEPRLSPPEPHGHARRADRASFSRFNNSRVSNALPGVDAQGQRRPVPYKETHSPGINPSPHGARRASHFSACLPSPVSSENSPSSLGPSQLSPTTPVRSMRQEQREIDKERYGNGSLDAWFLRLSQASQPPGLTEESQAPNQEPSLSQLTQNRFGPSSGSPDSSSVSNIEPSQTQLINRPPSPMLDLDSTEPPPRVLPQPAKFVNKPGLPVLEQWSARLYNASSPDENPELQKALEFETRKKAAIQERRKQLQSSASVSASTNSPHQSKYLAARAALSSQPDSIPRVSVVGKATSSDSAVKPLLSPHDPRAYLLRLQNDGPGSSKLKRIASGKLPFEKIPDGYDLHAVGLRCPVDMHLLRASSKAISKSDLYTRSGDQSEGFTSPNINADITTWHDRLSELIRAQYRSSEGSDFSRLEFDFSGISQISRASV